MKVKKIIKKRKAKPMKKKEVKKKRSILHKLPEPSDGVKNICRALGSRISAFLIIGILIYLVTLPNFPDVILKHTMVLIFIEVFSNLGEYWLLGTLWIVAMILGIVILYRLPWRIMFPDMIFRTYEMKRANPEGIIITRLHKSREGRVYFIDGFGLLYRIYCSIFDAPQVSERTIYFKDSVFPLLNPINPSNAMDVAVTNCKVRRNGLFRIEIDATSKTRVARDDEEYWVFGKDKMKAIPFMLDPYLYVHKETLEYSQEIVTQGAFVDPEGQKKMLDNVFLFIPPDELERTAQISRLKQERIAEKKEKEEAQHVR